MTTITPKAAGRVNNPKRMASPPKNSTKTATPVCQYSNPKFSCHDKALDWKSVNFDQPAGIKVSAKIILGKIGAQDQLVLKSHITWL